MPYEITYQEISPKIGNPITFTSATASAEIHPVTDGSTYRISVVAINSLGARGPVVNLPDYTVIGKLLPPADVTGLSITITKYGNYLKWNANTDIDLLEYEVRKGSSWDLGTTIFAGSTSTSFTDTDIVAGNETYWIKAKDTSGNYSINPATVTSNVINSIASVAPSITVVSRDYVLKWSEPYSLYAIKEYEIRVGVSWVNSVLINITKSTSIQNPVNWAGDSVFWIVARDIANNESTPVSVSLNISLPNKPNNTNKPPQVVDNNVLLYWNDCSSSLPIDYYNVRIGSTFAGSTLIGPKSGLFTTVFETTSGTYTYWISGVDSAGNEGPALDILCNVSQPPDYILNANLYSTFTGTLNNAVLYNGEVSLPHNITETWTTHFTSKTWTTPQDQINAGYPVFGQPTGTTGFYEEVFDYGTILASNKITVLYNAITINNPVVTVTISTSPTGPNDSPPGVYAWTNYVGTSTAYATNFRYIKVKISVASTGIDFMDLEMLNVKLDAKIKKESGQILQCMSTDVGDGGRAGTQVNFSTPFVDINSIVTQINTGMGAAIPAANWPHTLIVDFIDTPNPTGFRVLWYDKNGVRINSPANYYISWSAEGF